MTRGSSLCEAAILAHRRASPTHNPRLMPSGRVQPRYSLVFLRFMLGAPLRIEFGKPRQLLADLAFEAARRRLIPVLLTHVVGQVGLARGVRIGLVVRVAV